MKVIVNADDCGISNEVNEAIFELIQTGRLTSVSLIANGPSIKEAASKLRDFPKVSKGVHLNLTEFIPLTTSENLGPLRVYLNEEGGFCGEQHLRSLTITPPLLNAIFIELSSQIDAVMAMGIHVSHLDSHNHIHTIPGLFPVLKRLQRHFGIRKVRTTWNIFPPVKPISWGSRLKKQMWHLALRHYYSTVTTDGFTSLADFVEVASTKILPFKSVELMVHPGHSDFTEETNLLHSNWQSKVLARMDFVSYESL
mgnify:FL=1